MTLSLQCILKSIFFFFNIFFNRFCPVEKFGVIPHYFRNSLILKQLYYPYNTKITKWNYHFQQLIQNYFITWSQYKYQDLKAGDQKCLFTIWVFFQEYSRFTRQQGKQAEVAAYFFNCSLPLPLASQTRFISYVPLKNFV